MVNQLMQPTQQPPQLGMQQPQSQPQIQQPTPEQIQQAHEHFTDSQKMLDDLIKLPDSELNLSAVYDAAAEMISKYGQSGGKKGIPAAAIVKELSNPNFPAPDANGNPPSAEAIRKFLQMYFDQSVMTQSAVTAKFGPPTQQQ